MGREGITRIRIENGNRCRDRHTCCRTDRVGQRQCRCSQFRAKPDVLVSDRLTGDQALSEQPDHFRALGKFGVVEPVADLECRQVENRDAGILETFAIDRVTDIDLTEPVDIA